MLSLGGGRRSGSSGQEQGGCVNEGHERGELCGGFKGGMLVAN